MDLHNGNVSPPALEVPPPLDLAALKVKQRVTWGTGDYGVIGTTLQLVGESLCEALDLDAGEHVLDIACGNGNATLAAARRHAIVTGVDYVPSLLESGRARARAEGLSIDFREGDAEHLPYPDGSFDVVMSSFGTMFSPDQERVASELLRLCRPGGRIGLSNWTPTSFVGQLFGIVGRYLPPPKGLRSPSEWGDEARLRTLFAGHDVKIVRKEFVFRYLSSHEWLDVFRAEYGPVRKAFEALGDKAPALGHEILLLIERCARKQVPLQLPSEYVEVVIRR